MKGIVIDAKNPSQAYLEGYPNSNCEQYQEMLDQVPANKRKAFVEKIQTHYQKLLTQRKLEFKDSVNVLSDEIEKFLASGGTISMGKNGTYLFNGFLTLRAEPFFFDRTMYETQLKNLKERKQMYVDELSDLNEKANKHLFKSLYKKEEREQLKRDIFSFDQRICDVTEEYEKKLNEFEDVNILFNQAKAVLTAVEKVTFLVNSINKTKRLLAYTVTDKKISAKKFAEEYKEKPVMFDKKLAHEDVISTVIEKNKDYRKKLSCPFMRENRDEAVNIQIELPKKKEEQSEMVR